MEQIYWQWINKIVNDLQFSFRFYVANVLFLHFQFDKKHWQVLICDFKNCPDFELSASLSF